MTTTPEQRVYNTAVPVVANVTAGSPEQAYARLADALRAAGFEPMSMNEVAAAPMAPFVAEPGTEADR